MSLASLDSSDFVLSIKYPLEQGVPTQQAKDNLSKLVKALTIANFYIQTRPGDNDTLLLFVKAEDKALFKLLKSLSIKEYLHGLKYEIEDDEQIITSLTHTEKSRAVNGLLTYPEFEGGIGITPGSGSWEFVSTISPIYDYKVNSELFWKWFKKPLIDESDISRIREFAGEEVALYFGYLRFYVLWLIIPTVLGFIANWFFSDFSIGFTVLNSLWAIFFINAWKRKELDYVTSWNVKGSSKVEVKRAEFKGDTEDIDLITGTKTPYYSPEKRTLTKVKFIPTAIFGGLLLLTYQLLCFFIEIFLTEIYQGPGKGFLGLVPTILIIGGSPYVTAFYSTFVNKAVDAENHETNSSYENSVTQKLYVHNFLASYAPLFITTFLYLPFGHKVNSYLSTLRFFTSKFNVPIVEDKYQISTGRLVGQFGFFTHTSLIIGFTLENFVPVTIRLVKEKLAKKSAIAEKDAPEEALFLDGVRKQVAKPKFSVNNEYREIVLNFGYLVMFGPVWSLAPFYSLISNYIEIKGDLEKLLYESQRPVPTHVDSIGPWNTNLEISTWVGTVVAPIVTTFFRQQDQYISSSIYNPLVTAIGVPIWKATGAALVFENLSIILNFFVSTVYKSSYANLEHKHEQKALYTRRAYVDATLKNPAFNKRDIVIDQSTSAWKTLTGDNILNEVSKVETINTAKATATGASLKADGELRSRLNRDHAPIENISEVKTVPSLADEANFGEKPSVSAAKSSAIPLAVETTPAPNSVPDSSEAALPIRDTSPISEGSGSLNGATLPPNFPLKKNLSESSSQVAQAVADSESALSAVPVGDDTSSENPLVQAAQSIETHSSKVGEISEKASKTIEPTGETPAQPLSSLTVADHQAAPGGTEVHQKPVISSRNDSASGSSQTSTPHKHKSGLLKSIKKKAQGLHLPSPGK